MKHAIRAFAALSALTLLASELKAQTFTNASNLLPESYNSGGCIGFADLDGDGFDDLIVLDQSNILHTLYQTPDGGFVDHNLGLVSEDVQWGMCVADFDNDGHKDVFSGGRYDGVFVQNITAPGEFTTLELGESFMFMQACNWVDIDNDGMLDAFGCHDDALSRLWHGNGEGGLTPANELIDLTSYDLTNYPNTDHSGNYGSVWTDVDNDGDIDLFIAKCRQGIDDPNDPRRVNQLWVNDGNGGWTEEALERGLVLYEQSWTTDFADIDNDGDFDCLATNHSNTIQLLENDGTGHFNNITEGSGLEVTGFFLQAKLDDFDNDGFVDLIYTGGDDGFFRNNGDHTFSEVPNLFPYNDVMHSFVSGDVNRDGQLDVYASYGDNYVTPDSDHPDVLWVNDGSDHNWIAFDLEGVQSNVDAVGAKVVLTGAFGTMVREVRAGESYGITCALTCRFGLGDHDVVDEAVVKWPSGIETAIPMPAINQYHNVVEAPCVAQVEVLASQASFCPGETVTLTATEGYTSYSWSNEADSAAIEVDESGSYTVLVGDTAGCVGLSNLVVITEILGNTPTIDASGSPDLCAGITLLLTASPADNYAWSTGEETQSIEVTEPGSYSVGSVDICGNAGWSDTLVVELFDAPSGAPQVGADVTIAEAGDVLLEASGSNIRWYDAEVGGNLLAQGSTYTPMVTETSTFWAEDAQISQEEAFEGGELTNQPQGGYHNNGARWLEFDVHQDIRLNSVTLFANGNAPRSFELIDGFGEVLESTTVLVEDGEFVLELNWDIAPGINYGLRCTSSNPQLWREGTDTDLNYPYEVGDLLTVTNSTAGPSLLYYYFFYKWVAEPLPVECVSGRTPVTVTIDPSLDVNGANGPAWSVMPNPVKAGGELRMAGLEMGTPFRIVDVQGRTVHANTWTGTLAVNWPAGWYAVVVEDNSEVRHQVLMVH